MKIDPTKPVLGRNGKPEETEDPRHCAADGKPSVVVLTMGLTTSEALNRQPPSGAHGYNLREIIIRADLIKKLDAATGVIELDRHEAAAVKSALTYMAGRHPLFSPLIIAQIVAAFGIEE